MSEMTLRSSDIPALFELAKAGDVSARDRLSDAAGTAASRRIWEAWHKKWFAHPADIHGGEPWDMFDPTWTYWGRHAPLVSLDCAASIPLPVGDNFYSIEWVDLGIPYGLRDRLCRVYFGGANVAEFPYTDPAHRALAECCARLWANAHERESSHDAM